MTPVQVLLVAVVLMTCTAVFYCLCYVGTRQALEYAETRRLYELKTMSAQAAEKDRQIEELHEKIAQMEAVRTRSIQI